MMKEHYQGAPATPEPEPAEPTTTPGDRGVPDAIAALREAFDHLVAAGRELGERAADVARDDEVKAQAKRAATTLNDALSATVDMIGNEVSGWFARPQHDDQPAGQPDAIDADETPSSDAPADPAARADDGPSSGDR
jgi:hypothetical protein